MDNQSIFDEVSTISARLSGYRSIERTKLTGALAIEVIRKVLASAGLSVSTRDVFIQGDPAELDTLVVRPTAVAEHGILYNPLDVAAVLEIKFSGVYSQDVPTKLRNVFDRIRSAHPHIQCVYLTLCENPKFKYRITTEVLGHTAFTLNWWTDYKKAAVRTGHSVAEVVLHLQCAVAGLPQVCTFR